MSKFEYVKLDIPLASGIKYDDIDRVEVRGFRFREMRDIANGNVEAWSLSDIVSYYKDVIKLYKDDNEVPLGKLCELDLYLLMFFVNVLSNNDYKMYYKSRCNKCKSLNEFTVTIDGIEFENSSGLMTVPIRLDKVVINVNRMTVLGLLAKDSSVDLNKFSKFDKSMIDVAKTMTVEITDPEYKSEMDKVVNDTVGDSKYSPTEKSLLESLLVLDDLGINEMSKLVTVIDDMKLSIKPVEINCECGNHYLSSISLTKHEVLPHHISNIVNQFRVITSN